MAKIMVEKRQLEKNDFRSKKAIFDWSNPDFFVPIGHWKWPKNFGPNSPEIKSDQNAL